MNTTWQLPLSTSTINRYWWHKKQLRIIKIIAVITAIIGVVALLLYLLTAFGQAKSPWLIIFYFSLWFDLYLFTDHIKQNLKVNKIKPVLKQLGKNENLPINLAELLSTEVTEALYRTHQDNQPIDALPLFWQLVQNTRWLSISAKMGISREKLNEVLQGQIANQAVNTGDGLTSELWSDINDAFNFAVARGLREIDTLTVTRTIYASSEILHEIFMELGVDENEFNGCLDWLQVEKILWQRSLDYKKSANLKVTGDMNAAYTASATPILNTFSVDLTMLASRGELMLCMGRDHEMNDITDYFQSGGQGIILVGATGVGKQAIIEGIAQHMVEERVPSSMQDKRLILLSLDKIIGGVSSETAQKRLLYILDEVRRAGNIILAVENLEEILTKNQNAEAGGDVGIDVGAILAKALTNKEIMLLATSSDKIYEHFVEKTALGQNLHLLRLDEPDINETVEILMTRTAPLEYRYKIKITYDALLTAAEMSKRYITDKKLPAKAIEILKLAAIKTNNQPRQNHEVLLCSETEVMAVISGLTNIPLEKVSGDESAKLLGLEDEIHQHLIGQNEAVVAISRALRRARTDLRQNKNQPLASFLFLGPTGVGKTQLAKTIAKVYFGDEKDMIRLDMSEYQLPTDAVKMIGSPDGNSLGYLTEAVRSKPYSLILFDEIEKAHPDILNLFLQMLDDGRLTNGLGVTVDFANTIIIATSNVGATYIQEAVRAGQNYTAVKDELLNKLLFEKFRPEFINRFDDTIVFSPLSETEIAQIVKLILDEVANNLSAKGIKMQIDDNAIQFIARASYNAAYGARPIRRYIKDNLESQIADLLLTGQLETRDTAIIQADETQKLVISIQKATKL
jgi:ATP-dependent Clp protease ATP-binding subunit ClpC